MKTGFLIKKLLIGVMVFFAISAGQAASKPLWVFNPMSSTSVKVLSTGTGNVKYLVTNQSKRAHTLLMEAIPGVTQVTKTGNCSSPFVLGYKQSCILNLNINGSALPGNIIGGPVVCQSGNPNQCYRPGKDNILKITKVFSVGGNLSGLNIGESVVLQNNNGDNLKLSSNGSFTFSTGLLNHSTYKVTVLKQPPGQICTVTNGTGKIAGTNVTNVLVQCKESAKYTVGGSLTGLNAGETVVLQNNKGDNLILTKDSPFTFSTPLLNGSTYHVTVLTQPSGQTCSVTNASGVIAGADVKNIIVTCVQGAFYSVGGTLSGLNPGETIVIQNNGADNLTLTADNSFTFPLLQLNGSSYNVTVLTQPTGQTCKVTQGSGTIAGANVTNVTVNCKEIAIYTVGGTLKGLNIKAKVVLQNNKGDNLTLTNDGSFTFSKPLPYGATYDVTVLTQPANQNCTVRNGSGVIKGSDIKNVVVLCTLTLPIVETFTGSSTTYPWCRPLGFTPPPPAPTPLNLACLTAGISSQASSGCGAGQSGIPACGTSNQGGYNKTTPDKVGQGALRLTTADTSQEGGVIFQRLFDMKQKGLAIQFTAYAWGGNIGPIGSELGADGISFFLIDGSSGTVPPALGPFGSGLGYGNNWEWPNQGIANGYIGVGFDEFGYYCIPNLGGTIPNCIAVRGPTGPNGKYNNTLLSPITGTLNPELSCNASTKPACSPSTARRNITGVNTGRNVYRIEISKTGIMDVYRNSIPLTALTNMDLVSQTGQPLPPAVYFGFAASTGGRVNIHEITDFLVDTYGSLFTVGGVVQSTFPNGKIVLQNENGEILSLVYNGGFTEFTFPTAQPTNTKYNVTVKTQPAGQFCTVGQGSGTITKVDVQNIVVSCF